MKEQNKYSKGGWVLWSFIAFFGTIASLDAFFIYKAISTNSGVVIENPYEKGLAYNKTLEQAKSQPKWQSSITIKDDLLRWQLFDENNKPITGAIVKANIIRPIHKNYDFDVILEEKNNGIYTANLKMPLKGRWIAKMSSKWNNKTYQTTYEFIKK